MQQQHAYVVTGATPTSDAPSSERGNKNRSSSCVRTFAAFRFKLLHCLRPHCAYAALPRQPGSCTFCCHAHKIKSVVVAELNWSCIGLFLCLPSLPDTVKVAGQVLHTKCVTSSALLCSAQLCSALLWPVRQRQPDTALLLMQLPLTTRSIIPYKATLQLIC